MSTSGIGPLSGPRLSGEREHHGRFLDVVRFAGGYHRGADREELDHVRSPAVTALDDPGTDDAAGLQLVGLALHPLHRQLACLVQRLGEVRHLDVLAHLLERGEHPLTGDVVDAVAHHQTDRSIPRPQKLGEVLPAQVAGERTPVRSAVQLAAAVLDRGADRDELGQVGAPLVAADVEAHADDPIGAELVGLLLHPGHGQLAGVVHRLSQHAELLALVPARLLPADVVDRAAQHEPERLEPRLLDQQELVHRQVAGEEPARDLLLHARDPLAAGLGDAGERARLVGGLVRRFGRRERGGVRRRLCLRLRVVVVVSSQKSHRVLLVYSISRRSSARRVASLRLASAASASLSMASHASVSSSSFFRTIPADSFAQRHWTAPRSARSSSRRSPRSTDTLRTLLGPNIPALRRSTRTRPGTASSSLAAMLSTNALRSLESARSEAASRSRSTPALSDDTALRLLDVFRPVTVGKSLGMTTQTTTVPYVDLNDGNRTPQLGFGVFQV